MLIYYIIGVVINALIAIIAISLSYLLTKERIYREDIFDFCFFILESFFTFPLLILKVRSLW